MTEATVTAAPYAHDQVSVARTMGLVMIALFPATAFSLYQFGWPAINLFAITMLAALAFEALCLKIAGRPLTPFLTDGSALLSGWLVAFTLPPWAPWWIGVMGAAIALIIGKHIFGGLGQNVFNPAMVARVMLLISFPVQMTTWVKPVPIASAGAPDFWEGLKITFQGGQSFDAVTSASLLGALHTDLSQGKPLSESLTAHFDIKEMILGTVPGSLGETSVLFILIGGLFLLATRIISWRIPVSMFAAMAAIASLFHFIDPDRYADAFVHIASGGFMLCAFFIATDYVTSPVSALGQLVYGAATAFLIYVIRTWAAFPEGVGFAVLLMNAATPMIDHYIRPRIYGRTRRGEPLSANLKGKR